MTDGAIKKKKKKKRPNTTFIGRHKDVFELMEIPDLVPIKEDEDESVATEHSGETQGETTSS